MQRLEVSGAVRPLYGSLGVKGLMLYRETTHPSDSTTGNLNHLVPELFFLILAHPVYKM